MTLTEVIFSIILSVASAPFGSPPADAAEDQERLHNVAKDIALVSEKDPVFLGPEAAKATALALLTIAQMESGFWHNVQDCSLCYRGSDWCDQGKSITLFQLQGKAAWGPFTREQLCSSNEIATQRAHAVLSRFRRLSTPLAMFAAYGRGGDLDFPPSKTARKKDRVFRGHLSRQGVWVGWKNGGLWAEGVPTAR